MVYPLALKTQTYSLIFSRIEYWNIYIIEAYILAMNYLDLLPLELLHVIARDSEPAYKALLAYPRFAHVVTPGTRIDYMVHFGHNVRVNKYGNAWTRNGIIHRKDCPALIRTNGHVEWWVNGLRHRDGEPAVIGLMGKFWYRRGMRHRDDGPALQFNDGSEFWYRDGLRHRDDGPAFIYADGNKYWYNNGKHIQQSSGNMFTNIASYIYREISNMR